VGEPLLGALRIGRSWSYHNGRWIIDDVRIDGGDLGQSAGAGSSWIGLRSGRRHGQLDHRPRVLTGPA
jgi:hypothetical protein